MFTYKNEIWIEMLSETMSGKTLKYVPDPFELFFQFKRLRPHFHASVINIDHIFSTVKMLSVEVRLLPLYRQTEIYARSGLELERGQLAGWLGHTGWLLRPLVDLIAAHVMAGRVIHAGDTPVPVLAPGAGKTTTDRQWVYLRDERPHAGTAQPAVLYRYTPDRKGEHCGKELANVTGGLHADGYAGSGRLYESAGARSASADLLQGPPRVAEVSCWSHVRRGFFDDYAAHKGAIAKEALDRIGALFDIERTIAGKPPDVRRDVR